MSRDAALTLLKERLGLDPDSLGMATIEAALARRTLVLQLADPAAYVARLAGDAQEWQALVNEIVVPETWFFRGGDLFFYLADHLQGLARRRDPAEPVRILSAACSTGEEPYSLAIALTESGLPPGRWRLDALDISTRHIETARAGRYGAFSFREMDPVLQRRYFQPVAGGWEIAGSLRGAVHFQTGNLAGPLLPVAQPYDLIFCRNVLIYLLPATRHQALANLDRLLAADGLLCIGHADTLGELERRFTRFGLTRYFLYQRAATPSLTAPAPARPKAVASARKAAAPRVAARPSRSSVVRKSGPPFVRREGEAPAEPVPAQPDLLARARQLGDGGQLAEALACCHAHLEAHGPSAACLGLMGVLHKARQEHDEAVRCLLNALYLQPDHTESLTHLMLLRRLQGRHHEAELLQRRLERAQSRGDA